MNTIETSILELEEIAILLLIPSREVKMDSLHEHIILK